MMADLDAAAALRQEVQAMRWVVNQLRDPLSCVDLGITSVDLEALEAILAFVAIDPFAQFSPAPLTAASPQAQVRTPRQAAKSQWSERRSPLPSSHLSRELHPPSPLQPTSNPMPVFSLRPLALEHHGRSDSIPHQELSNAPPKPPSLAPSSRSGNTPLNPMALTEENSAGDRSPLPLQPPPPQAHSRPSPDFQPPVSCTRLSPPSETSLAQPQVQTLALIEQILDQWINHTSSSDSTNHLSNNSSLSFYSPSISSSTKLPALPSLISSSASSLITSLTNSSPTVSSTHSPLFFSATAVENPLSEQSILPPRSTFPPPSFDLSSNTPALSPASPDLYSPAAEMALAEMAETLALLVNDVLIEQARRHGVELS